MEEQPSLPLPSPSCLSDDFVVDIMFGGETWMLMSETGSLRQTRQAFVWRFVWLWQPPRAACMLNMPSASLFLPTPLYVFWTVLRGTTFFLLPCSMSPCTVYHHPPMDHLWFSMCFLLYYFLPWHENRTDFSGLLCVVVLPIILCALHGRRVLQ